jgi:hypothetical protein
MILWLAVWFVIIGVIALSCQDIAPSDRNWDWESAPTCTAADLATRVGYQCSLAPETGNNIRPGVGTTRAEESAHKGIESVKTSAPAAKVVDLTEREPAHN